MAVDRIDDFCPLLFGSKVQHIDGDILVQSHVGLGKFFAMARDTVFVQVRFDKTGKASVVDWELSIVLGYDTSGKSAEQRCNESKRMESRHGRIGGKGCVKEGASRIILIERRSKVTLANRSEVGSSKPIDLMNAL